MRFYKLQATGNDFIFFLKENVTFSREQRERLCHRQYGIGADGLVVLQETGPAQYTWQFYNADGAEAEMCGNAARAAIYLLSKVEKQNTARVKTMKGFFQGKALAGENVEIRFALPEAPLQKVTHLFSSRFTEGYITNTGVPHCVIPVKDLSTVLSRSAELKEFIYDKHFGTAGANLTFYAVTGEKTLAAATLERGVNDFTLSCGTGVIAAVQVYQYLNPQVQGAITVKAPGGELTVDLSHKPEAVLRGEAQIVFEGSLA